MATLHVRNVPDELYEALRARAKQHGRSINAETIALLEPALESRDKLPLREWLERTDELRSRQRPSPGAPGVVEMIRADRDR